MIIRSNIQTASKGIAIGKAYLIRSVDLTLETYTIQPEDITAEIRRFDLALEETAKQLSLLAAKSSILAGHMMITEDNELRDAVLRNIQQQMNAEQALSVAIEDIVVLFEQMKDPYMKERSVDIWDIGKRILCNLKNIKEIELSPRDEPIIIIAKELFPSELASLNLDMVAGIITEQGGLLGHITIMAENMGLPCLVGVLDLLEQIKDGEDIILDASKGQVIIDPDQETLNLYIKRRDEIEDDQRHLPMSLDLPAITKDQKLVKLFANVSGLEGVKQAAAYGMDGIGLFRSEFIYMGRRNYPSEEELYLIYKEAGEVFSKEIIIRTLDIGGDKELPYDRSIKEENPALGCRGIRASLKRREIFKRQLRAILRASAYGRLKIMFPMITTIEEFLQAKDILEECKEELAREGHRFNESIELGMMVETPAAVITLGDFVKIADFFSIGSNDLTQYILAVDRNSFEYSDQYNSFQPAVLRSIHKAVEIARIHNKKISVCGELASDSKAVQLLIGMGLEEISISLKVAEEIREVIRNSNYQEAVILTDRVLKASKAEDIKKLL